MSQVNQAPTLYSTDLNYHHLFVFLLSAQFIDYFLNNSNRVFKPSISSGPFLEISTYDTSMIKHDKSLQLQNNYCHVIAKD